MKRVPAALAIALVGGFVVARAINALLVFHEWHGDTMESLYQLWGFEGMAEGVLMLVGALALRRMVAPGAPRAIADVAAAASAIVLAGTCFWVIVLPIWHPDYGGQTFHELDRALAWIDPIGLIALYTAFAALGARASRPESFAIPVVVALLQLVRTPIPPLGAALRVADQKHAILIHAACEIVIVAGALYGVIRASAPRGDGWWPAERGLARAATALAWRVGLTVALIPLFLLAYLARSQGLAKLLAISVPTGLVIAGVIAIASLLQASHADDDSAPRLQLAGAAGLLAMGATFDVLSLVNAFIFVFDLHVQPVYELDKVGVLLWALPAIGVLGMLAFLAALAAIARRVQAGVDPARVGAVAATLALVTAGSLWVQHVAMTEDRPSLGALATVSVIALVVSLACAIIVVRMTRAVAAALGGAPSLPTAIAKLS